MEIKEKSSASYIFPNVSVYVCVQVLLLMCSRGVSVFRDATLPGTFETVCVLLTFLLFCFHWQSWLEKQKLSFLSFFLFPLTSHSTKMSFSVTATRKRWRIVWQLEDSWQLVGNQRHVFLCGTLCLLFWPSVAHSFALSGNPFFNGYVYIFLLGLLLLLPLKKKNYFEPERTEANPKRHHKDIKARPGKTYIFIR